MPPQEELCEDYDLDESVCDDAKDNYDNNKMYKDLSFNFNLICKVDQDGLYEAENDDQMAEVRRALRHEQHQMVPRVHHLVHFLLHRS